MEGWSVGQVAPNITLDDQFENALDLYQFYGYIINITVTAPWCPVDLYDAAQAEARWQAVRERGVIFIDVYSDDASWKAHANNAGIHFPVLGDELWTVASAAGIAGTVPGTIIIDRDMRIRAVSTGTSEGPGALAAMLAEEQCGNGIADPGETCDDGNIDAWDGCSPACQIDTCRFEDDYGAFLPPWSAAGEFDFGYAAFGGLPGEALARGGLYVELRHGLGPFAGGAAMEGTYTLDGADLDPATCGICVYLADYQYDSDWHFAVGGTVEIVSTSPSMVLQFNDLAFQAIQASDDGTPHPSGCTSAIDYTLISVPLP